MPTFVMKVDRDRDLYVGWSTVVEQAAWIGTREEALRILARDIPAGYAPLGGGSPEDRLARADACGTSALYPPEGPFDGAFDDTGQIVEQRGFLRRADFGRYIDAYAAGDEAAAFALLQPFDDDEEAS